MPEPYEEVCPICGHVKDLDEPCYGCGVDHLKSGEPYDPLKIGNFRLVPTRLYKDGKED